MRYKVFCILLLCFVACAKSEVKSVGEDNASVSLELNDEKIEVNEKNLPLPVKE